MKNPILLQGRTMESAGVVRPLSMQQAWKEDGDSTAVMTMRIEDEDIPVSAWLKVFSPNGMSAVMYVKTKKTDYVARTVTYTLEHCFHLLEEMIVFGEITPATMGGSETEVSVRSAIQYLLSRQTTPLFQLGTCNFTETEGWKFTNSDVYSDLMSLTDSILDCMWEFDMDTLPWTLSLVPWETADAMEMRMNRNMASLNISLDKSNMYTRVYPTGKNNLHINGDYIDMNTATWGIIGKVITDGSIDSEPLLRAWATKMLKRNATPALNVSVNAMDLSAATGESLDRFVIGRVCRIPLPEYGTVIRDRIISVTWQNVCQDEENCTVNMANERKTVQGVLNEIARSGGAGSKKGGTASAKAQQEQEEKFSEFYTEYERTNREINERAVHWNESEEILKAAGMHRDNEGNIIYATDNVRQIGSQIVSLDDRASLMVGRYNITEDKLRRYAGKSAFPATGTEGLFYVDVYTSKTYVWKDGKYNEITVGKNGEGYYVKAGEIAVALNESGEATAHIDAKKVILGQAELRQMDLDDWAGDAVNGEGVFAKYLTVKRLTAHEISTLLANIGDADIGELSVEGDIHCDFVDAARGGFDGIVISDGGYLRFGGKYMNIYDAEVSGNVLTLKRIEGGNLTFSKATQLSGNWSGGAYKVTAKQNGKSVGELQTQLGNLVPTGSVTVIGKTVFQKQRVMYEEGSENFRWTGAALSAMVDASSVYNKGWNAARAKVSLPSTSSTATSFSVSVPPATVDGAAQTDTYTLHSASNDIVVVRNSGSTIVARLEHGKYTAGYNQGLIDGAGGVTHSMSCTARGLENSIPSGSSNAGRITKSLINSFSYLTFTMSCGGTSQKFYFVLS